MAILVTGGMGFIGSHTVVELINVNEEVIILDNLSNSSIQVLDRIKQITGKTPIFYQGDILDENILRQIMKQHSIEAVIHFAGLKAVGESVALPEKYYRNNVSGSLTLFRVMAECGVNHLIFSSSATVYGNPHKVPIDENMPVGGTTNPYGTSKLMIEQIIKDIGLANPNFNATILRYFNPIGAHKSGLIGENPRDIPNNLLPYITQVAVGKLEKLSVYGNDYPTPDGTGVRDYIHVVDLSLGHLKALQVHRKDKGVHIYNLGTGNGYSVLEIVHTFEKVNDIKIPYQIVGRRSGDIAECYADPSLAKNQLGWETQYDLKAMLEDAWRWQKNNPNGLD